MKNQAQWRNVVTVMRTVKKLTKRRGDFVLSYYDDDV